MQSGYIPSSQNNNTNNNTQEVLTDEKGQKFDLQPVNDISKSPEVTVDEKGQKFDLQPVAQTKYPKVDTSDYSGIKGAALATIAGASNFATGTGETIGDAGIWAARMLGKTGLLPANATLTNQDADQLLSQLNNKLKSGYSSEYGNQSDPFNASLAQHPYIGGAAQYVPAALTLAKTAVSGLSKVPAVGKIANYIPYLSNFAARAAVNATVGAGLAGKNSENQDLGAAFSGALTPLGDLAAYGLNKLASKVVLPEKLQQYVSAVYQRIKSAAGLDVKDSAVQAEGAQTQAAITTNNDNYNAIKQLPGVIPAKPIQMQANRLMRDTGSTYNQRDGQLMWNHEGSSLSDAQREVLQTVQQDANRMDTMEKAVKLRQYIAANYSKFKGATDYVKNAFDNLKTSIDGAIRTKATPYGLANQFDHANDYYGNVMVNLQDAGAIDRLNALNKKAASEAFNASQPAGAQQAPIPSSYTTATKQIFPPNMTVAQAKEQLSRLGPNGNQIMEDHLVQSTIGNAVTNPDNININSLLLKVNNTVDKYNSILSEQTKQTFQGIKTLLQQAGAVAKKDPSFDHSFWIGHILGGIAGGAAGGYEGYEHGGSKTSIAIGGLAGAVGGAAAFKGLIDTKIGQSILRHIANNPIAARQLITAPLQAPAASLNMNNTGNQ